MTVAQTAAPPTSADGRSFVRLDPVEAAVAQLHGALLVDIRPGPERARHGEIPGALVVAGPMRDWRVDVGDPLRICELGATVDVVVVGDGGSASILAASALRGHGVNATDVAGGFPAWTDRLLPTCAGTTRAGHYVDGDRFDAGAVGAGNLPCADLAQADSLGACRAAAAEPCSAPRC